LAKLLKNLYNHDYISTLSYTIKKYYKNFDTKEFESFVFDDYWTDKELKQRMRHISCSMCRFIPEVYEKTIVVLMNTFKDMDINQTLQNMIFQDFVEVYGLYDYDTSIKALELFTQECSSEFAIRQFILKYPQETMSQMEVWAKSSNEHHRRLASEGCRPRLPWAIALKEFKKDPSEILNILDILKDDKSAYVRKSVANNLNDISKDNPNIVKKIAKEWIGKSKERDALVKHACRTLLKASDSDALKLFGFTKLDEVNLKKFKYNKEVVWSGELEFSFKLDSKKPLGKLRLEYMMEFLLKNGKYSKKIFKIAEGVYENKSKTFSKKHSFKKISTRKYYAGVQKINIIINGEVYASKEFSILS